MTFTCGGKDQSESLWECPFERCQILKQVFNGYFKLRAAKLSDYKMESLVRHSALCFDWFLGLR